jgi:death-on-curing protein
MTTQEPEFLTREQVDILHEDQLATHGGKPGLRDENSLESAIAQPQHVYYYGNGDHFDVAAAYAYHISENQPYVDGNKRTGVEASLLYLEANGIETSKLPTLQTYNVVMDIANKNASRDDLADYLRSALSPEQKPTIPNPETKVENPYRRSSPEPEQQQAQPSNPYRRTEPQPERKPDQPTNPYKRPGIDDDTGQRH